MTNTRNEITVYTIRHRKTDLLIAMSDEMKGLYVHGRSFDELQERIPQAITALLEAEGHSDVNVWEIKEDSVPGFEPRKLSYQIQEREAA
ncbi:MULTISPECIES: hypothetical protein [Aurantimonas]|jgi:predicted RNase H-like HicB family nuclease|uniref:hypothetical protein n=1 Tax=Aurantimonas TaxID=182269 RepID=UPI003513F30D